MNEPYLYKFYLPTRKELFFLGWNQSDPDTFISYKERLLAFKLSYRQ